MAQIVISGEIFIDPANRAACLEAGKKYQQGTREDEPGCIDYVFSADPLRDNVMVVYERWADAASLELHFQHENYFKMRETFAKHGITGANVAKYRINAEDSVYVDGVATAKFADER